MSTPAKAAPKKAAPPEATAEKASSEPRFHVVGGEKCPVIRTYLDTRQNVVFDWVRRSRTVRNTKGDMQTVSYARRCVAPPEIQAAYRQPSGKIEIKG